MKEEGMLSASVEVRTSKYLNNLIEQDHRRVKQRYYPMLGFKNFNNAAVTLSGIRVSAEDQEGAVRQIKHQPRRDACSASVGSCIGSMKSDLEISLALAHPCIEFAPEPSIPSASD
ncbi:MAG: DDE-type integrase/transposase/recombinase [Bryobacteraceae bacterium]